MIWGLPFVTLGDCFGHPRIHRDTSWNVLKGQTWVYPFGIDFRTSLGCTFGKICEHTCDLGHENGSWDWEDVFFQTFMRRVNLLSKAVCAADTINAIAFIGFQVYYTFELWFCLGRALQSFWLVSGDLWIAFCNSWGHRNNVERSSKPR